MEKNPQRPMLLIERISQIIENEGVSVRAFEESIGAKQGSINRAIGKKSNVYSIVLEKILEKYPHYNAEWIITGKGEMLEKNKRALPLPSKKYRAGEELADILMRFGGLCDSSTERDGEKGKRMFKTGKTTGKAVRFDYDRIVVESSPFEDDETSSLSEEELKAMLFFVKASKSDFEYITGESFFSFSKAVSMIKEARAFLNENDESSTHFLSKDRNKVQKILKQLDAITLERDINARPSGEVVGMLSSGKEGYPLVEQCAIAGFGNADFVIKEEDVKAYYVVPKFQNNRIDFMIEVRGSSMYPKYNSGDVIACTIIKESRFIQWNKVHVIATREQGLLVKRLKPGASDDTYTVISDNKEYPPFEIPKSEVSDIALVVGVIRLE